MKKRYLLLYAILSPCLLYAQGISMGGGTASGTNSFSYGTNTTADGTASIAGGINSIATDTASIAIGEDSEARGKYAIALGKVAYVNAPNAVAIGSYCNVQSQYSLAFGLNNVIPQNSWYSTAIGAGNFATKDGAIAIGRDNHANGASSVAIGTQNTAHSFGEVVLGTYAKDDGYTPLNQYGTNLKDRLFVIGNGQSHATRSNAMLVLKNGNGSIQGGWSIGYPDNKITVDSIVKLQVNGGVILSETSSNKEQVLIGTTVQNSEAKFYIENTGFPYAMKIGGKRSSSGDAVFIDGGLKLNGRALIQNNVEVAGDMLAKKNLRVKQNVNIEGDLYVSGAVSKGSGTFMIDHPLDPKNKYLYHSFVESPDMMNIYNGNITTDKDGNATVDMPDYFQALNMEFRYQLTPMGQFAQAIVFEKIENNKFVIKTDKPNVEVSWQVTGVRNDAYSQKNRVKVSVEKPENEKGTYLHPQSF